MPCSGRSCPRGRRIRTAGPWPVRELVLAAPGLRCRRPDPRPGTGRARGRADAGEALDEVQLVELEAQLVGVEVDGVDHQGVAFPVADAVAEPALDAVVLGVQPDVAHVVGSSRRR